MGKESGERRERLVKIGDLPVQRRRRTIRMLLLVGGLALVLVIGYFGPRQWALFELSATDTPLTPWVRWYVTRSTDPALNQALVRRTEYTTWARVSTEASIVWSDKGIGAANYLTHRIDALLDERASLSLRDRRESRIDARLFRLFRALGSLLRQSGSGITLGGLYVGTPEQEEAFIRQYKEVRQKLLKGANAGRGT